MPVVIITKFIYVKSNKEALKLARKARMEQQRSEILSDAEYADKRLTLAETQNLDHWARNNPEPSK